MIKLSTQRLIIFKTKRDGKIKGVALPGKLLSQILETVSLFYFVGLELFDEAVHLFYANLSISPKSGKLESLVLDKRFIINEKSFEDVFGTIFLG